MSNLVYNAAKYSPASSAIRVGLSGSEAGIELSVENAGAPIAKEDLQALFEPLQRGKDEPAEESGDRSNLGLGLFIVHEIAKAHGGTIVASSNDGHTKFTMSLPCP